MARHKFLGPCPRCNGTGRATISKNHERTMKAVNRASRDDGYASIREVHEVIGGKRTRAGTNHAVRRLVDRGLLEYKKDSKGYAEWPFRVRVV